MTTDICIEALKLKLRDCVVKTSQYTDRKLLIICVWFGVCHTGQFLFGKVWKVSFSVQ